MSAPKSQLGWLRQPHSPALSPGLEVGKKKCRYGILSFYLTFFSFPFPSLFFRPCPFAFTFFILSLYVPCLGDLPSNPGCE